MKNISYDFHLHSCLSPCGDDDMTPANIVGMAAVIGLDAIALTDHNTCRNCPAAIAAGELYGVTVMPGMELCTSEEVHVLCFFPSLDEAMAFDDYVYEQALPDIENNPLFFGNQIIYDKQDEKAGTLEKLLISATTISFSQLPPYQGIMIPAHIDKSSNSLISNLGFIPPDSTFQIAELHDIRQKEAFCQRYPYLNGCGFLSSSDAHSLNDMNEPVNHISVEEVSVKRKRSNIKHCTLVYPNVRKRPYSRLNFKKYFLIQSAIWSF